jgi:outer membrane lipoprotein-sorting protein
MKKFITATITLILLVSTQLLFSQSVDDILKKHFEAIGQDNLLKVQTMVTTAKIVQSAQGMTIEMPMTMTVKRPNKAKMEATMQGQTMVTAFNGTDGWMIAPWMSPDPIDLTGEQLDESKDQADIDGALWNYKEKGNTVSLVGKEDMEGTEVYNLKLVKKNGTVENYYIDADSYILLKTKSKINANGTEIEVENVLSNYQTIDGIAMAMNIEVRSMGGSTQITLEKVDFNIAVDDSIFERPVKK